MNYLLKKEIKSLLSVLGIYLILMLCINNTLYIHIHITEEGRIVTHSHPYNQTGDTETAGSHSHSDTDYTFLNTLLISLVIIIATSIFLYRNERNYRPFKISPFKENRRISFHSDRAPPLDL